MDSRWKDVRNILCIRTGGLAEVLMCTPAIRALKHANPSRRITLLASPAGIAAAPNIPEIDHAIAYEAPWMQSSNVRDALGDRRLISKIEALSFDAAVIFTSCEESSLPAACICALADIPLSLAYCRENPHQLVSDWQHETEPERGVRHEVRRMLDLVAAIGASIDDESLSLQVYEPDRSTLYEKLVASGIDPDVPMIVFHPGAASNGENIKHIASVIGQVSRHSGCQILNIGSDVEMSTAINHRVCNLHRELELREMAALVKHSIAVLSADDALIHVAAAVCTPVIDLRGNVDGRRRPWQVPHCIPELRSGNLVEPPGNILEKILEGLRELVPGHTKSHKRGIHVGPGLRTS